MGEVTEIEGIGGNQREDFADVPLSVQIGTKLECQVPKVGPQWGWCARIRSSSWEQNKEFQRIFWN